MRDPFKITNYPQSVRDINSVSVLRVNTTTTHDDLTSLYWEYTTKGLEGERNFSRLIRTGHGWKRLAITNLQAGNKTDDQANLSSMKNTVNRTLCYWKCVGRQYRNLTHWCYMWLVTRRLRNLAPFEGIYFIFYVAGWKSVKEADLGQTGKLCSVAVFII